MLISIPDGRYIYLFDWPHVADESPGHGVLHSDSATLRALEPICDPQKHCLDVFIESMGSL